MGILDLFTGGGVVTEQAVQKLEEQLSAERETNLYLRESMADLELMLEDQGWERLLGDVSLEFSRAGLERAARLCRVMAVANPLIKRGLNVRQAYVFGGGVQVEAQHPQTQPIIKEFWEDESNKRSLSGSQAQEELERANGTDGNVFLACFTTPRTGRVEVRSFPFKEIKDIITNPEDRDEPWYYERIWTETVISPSGDTSSRTRKAYYPDIRYRPQPRQRPSSINGAPVNWNAPIYHVSVNRLDDWKFGIGDAFAAIAWARGYKEFLEDWAILVKALSRFAWRAKTKRNQTAAKLRDKIMRKPAIDPDTGQPLDTGATAVMSEDASLEAIPKTGAVIDSTSGKPLAAMVASALEISLVVLITDPGSTGARAVAETLDPPTILAMEKRQNLWNDAIRTICNYRIDAAVRAGKLPGTEVYDRDTRRLVTRLPDDEMRMLDITWPELGSDATKDRVESIVAADSTGKVPPQTVARLLLQALDVEDVDSILNEMLDESGEFRDLELRATMAAIRAFREGRDPASVYNGNGV